MGDVDSVTFPPDLAGSVSFRVRLVQIAAYKSFEKVIAGLGSAPRYFGLLKLVEANPGITQVRLAEAICLDRSSLVPILERLEREDWVERRASNRDRRVRRVFLTDAGAEGLRGLEREVARHESMMVAGLDGSEHGALIDMLGRIEANLRAALAKDEGPGA